MSRNATRRVRNGPRAKVTCAAESRHARHHDWTNESAHRHVRQHIKSTCGTAVRERVRQQRGLAKRVHTVAAKVNTQARTTPTHGGRRAHQGVRMCNHTSMDMQRQAASTRPLEPCNLALSVQEEFPLFPRHFPMSPDPLPHHGGSPSLDTRQERAVQRVEQSSLQESPPLAPHRSGAKKPTSRRTLGESANMASLHLG